MAVSHLIGYFDLFGFAFFETIKCWVGWVDSQLIAINGHAVGQAFNAAINHSQGIAIHIGDVVGEGNGLSRVTFSEALCNNRATFGASLVPVTVMVAVWSTVAPCRRSPDRSL